MSATSKPISACQVCGGAHLESVLFVGYIPPVNTMPPIGKAAAEQPAYPLEMLRCRDCGLVQIGLEVDQTVLFPYSYPYLSGSTRILRDNFAELAREAGPAAGLKPGDFVVDIGSNDGTLLAPFKELGYRVLGVEPSRASEVARSRGIDTLTGYFNKATAAEVKAKHGRAKTITAANVFAHIGSIHPVVEALVDLLDADGTFVSESHYLLDLVETLQYDTIYHEHLRYYALGSLSKLLADHGLEPYRVKRIPTHGGSIRVYAARKGTKPIDASVAERLAHEASFGITDGSALASFRKRVVQSKLDLMALLAPLRQAGARIYGIGAPSRASTLLNYVGADDGIVDCVLEISTSHKLDKYMPGTRIPVLDEKKLFEDQPEYALLLSWHIADELAALLRRKGFKGKFISPLPSPRVIEL
ncbi:MAG: class I SAM-dependent methyltransferase [Tagaea sp.]|nr:class I SAM-dependent methyltransferase [Tagaea sp.]